VAPFAPSSDGSYLAVADGRLLHVWKMGAAPQELSAGSASGNVCQLSWTSDNRMALLTVEGELHLFDVAETSLKKLAGPSNAVVQSAPSLLVQTAKSSP